MIGFVRNLKGSLGRCERSDGGAKENTRQDRFSGSYREEQVLLGLNTVCQAWKVTVRSLYTVQDQGYESGDHESRI